MDSVFLRFDSYDFGADQRFLHGLQTLQAGACGEEAKILDAKLFFYNRFVEPVDSISYKAWSSSGSSGEPSAGRDAEKSEESQGKSLSFAEVMRLVQEGQEVPGVTKVEIQASNQTETPSQMERIRKPWEGASASK
ncbi:uncharacterized protein C6orf226 homolog [Phycodurus eques]|uniref:uncharacterized protein C6orf226 homolog n=1 Tax=Phycodurus eques TaxID=693459 RepID=UPI002ACD96B3|nr:uncharacterized protein C6orf226 homolog [Phycodurus eques]